MLTEEVETGNAAVVGSTSSPDPAAHPASSRSSRHRLTTTALTDRAREGDVDAFAGLVASHEAELFRLAHRMLADRQSAQEVVAATLTQGWRQLPGSPRSVTFRVWMARTAMQRCLELLSQAAATGPTDADPDATGEDAPAPMDRADQGPSLAAAVLKLSPRDRGCWVLKDLHGLSDAEISYGVGVSAPSVPGRLAAARRRLADHLYAAG